MTWMIVYNYKYHFKLIFVTILHLNIKSYNIFKFLSIHFFWKTIKYVIFIE